MHLKLGIILDKKVDIKNNLDTIISETLYPYLSSSPIKEISLGNKYNKDDLKDKYRDYKMENYKGISNKKKGEALIKDNISTLEDFAKTMYGIIRFNDEGESIFGDNPNAFIDDYELYSIDKLKNYNKEDLAMNLKVLIDKELKVYHRETQLYKRRPSSVILPQLEAQNGSDYFILIKYIY